MDFPRIKISHLGMFLVSTQVETSIEVYPNHGISFFVPQDLCSLSSIYPFFSNGLLSNLGAISPQILLAIRWTIGQARGGEPGEALAFFEGPKEVQIAE